MLYSQELKLYSEHLPTSIEEAIIELKQSLLYDDIKILSYDKYNIAIPIILDINLPSKGNHNDIDIRSKEPILLTLNLKGYPTTSPRIKSDRKDFPTQQLSHLYAVQKDAPPTLCLVRENLDEWFANRQLNDLILIAKQWFSKAANGLLSEDGDEFEPIRLEGFRGYSIYSYNKLSDIVKEKKGFSEGNIFTFLLLSTKQKDSTNPTFKRFNINLSQNNFDELYKIVAEFNVKTIKGVNRDNEIEYPLFGILVWSNKSETINSYTTLLPNTYRELEDFAEENNISIKAPIAEYLKKGLYINNLTLFIPLIIGIKRPKKLIGFESDIEFLNFCIVVNEESINGNTINPNTPVFFQSHREPVASNLAQKLSLSENQDKTLFIGAGALGSKLIFHYARRGNFNLRAIDNDEFSPHNIVRHDLFMESSGQNKAKAVINKIKSFLDENDSPDFHEGNIFDYDRKLLKGFKWLIDTSASLNVQNWLVNSKLNEIPNIARAEVAYKGKLGFLYVEGFEQNPRIDDLVNYIYFLSTKDKVISDWLIEEQKKLEGNDYDIVDIGIGCNSPTVIMSNDSMSFHSSIFSKILNHENNRNTIGDKGLINISYVSEDGFEINSSSHIIPPLKIFKCQNNSGWEIRMQIHVLDKIKFEALKFKKKETGGIFIGLCNYKTKTIHVFDTVIAPKDSKRSNVYFYRGIKNLPEQVKRIKEISGGMIGYIGEWHTHPMGLDMLSGIDMDAVEKLKPLNDKYPIPTFISVLSKDKFLPFVF
jgi:hypothetical protein